MGQLVVAQFELERIAAELTRSGADISAIDTELRNIGQLQRQVGVADPAIMRTLRTDIAGAVAQVQITAQQARAAANGAEAREALSDIAEANRAQVNAVMAGMHRFDPYLQFGSAEEEAEYRRREAERRATIEAEQKKGTPEGDLKAAGAAVGQMADAAAHGAANSPEFAQQWDALVENTQKLRDQLIRDGGDVSKFDAALREDLRRIMKSKGLSDAEIDARLAAHPDNPLEAARGLVEGEQQVNQLATKVQESSALAVAQEVVSAPVPRSEPMMAAADAMAELQAAGVVMSGASDAPPAHGVTAQVAKASAPSRTV